MPDGISKSAQLLQLAMTGEDSVKTLMEYAASFLEEGDMNALHDIDVMLNAKLISIVRRGTADDLNDCIYSLLAFIDSSKGDRLKCMEQGDYLIHRWEHISDLCEFALEEYDPSSLAHFVLSRKHGEELLALLQESGEGLRPKDLAMKLNISNQNLSKLLKEFEKEDLISRERGNRVTVVRLGFRGWLFLAEREDEKPKESGPDAGEETDPHECNHAPVDPIEIPPVSSESAEHDEDDLGSFRDDGRLKDLIGGMMGLLTPKEVFGLAAPQEAAYNG